MIRESVFLVMLLGSTAAWAQGAVQQVGPATVFDLTSWIRDHQIQSVSKAFNDEGRGVNPFHVFDNGGVGLCFENVTTSGSYQATQLCIGHSGNSPIISFGGTQYPLVPGGAGNVTGPATTSVNEVASFNNATGTLLRQGAAVATDNKTAGIAGTGASLAGLTSNAVSADQILAYVFCTASCLPLPASGAGNYDGIRGVGISNSGTSVPIVAGVSGYVLANQPFSGAGPSSVALFGTGAVNVNAGSIWGLNTNVSDHAYRVSQGASTGNRRVTGAEIDVSASYTDTNIAGILVAGNSVVQPTNSTAVAVLGQDFSAATPGSIAKWQQAFYAYDGVAVHFALIGKAAATATANSQDIQFGASVSGSPYAGLVSFGTGYPGEPGTTPVFSFNYPVTTQSGGGTFRSAADQIVQLGGKIDLSDGVSIESRNDSGSSLLSLEILSSVVMINSSLVIGSVSPQLVAYPHELAIARTTAGNNAPGVGGGKIGFVCGTNAGTLKLITWGGSSVTPVTIVDNIGGGASGC
jgi:hypothetical protein